MQKIILLLISVLTITSLARCKSGDSKSETTVTDNLSPTIPSLSTVPNLSLTASPPPTKISESEENLTPSSISEAMLLFHSVPDIPLGYISSIRWSEEIEQTVLFTLSGESGSIIEWAYDLSDETTYMTDSQLVTDGQNTMDSPSIAFNMPTNVPTTLELVNLSPSGQKAIFFQGTGVPTSTPPPNPDGEIRAEAYIADVWLWDQNTIRKLGQIEVCSQNKYLWAIDEHLVAIQALPFPSPCRQANAWLVDVTNNVVTELLPFDIYFGQAELVSFSPNEAKLLFTESGINNIGQFRHLRTIELDTMQLAIVPVKTNVPIIMTPIDWIDNERVLILYREDMVALDRLAVIDLHTEELYELLDDEQLSKLERGNIRWAALSSNKQWLAFTVDRDPYKESDLWLFDITLTP